MKESTNTILTGGVIVDGTGAPPISGDIVIQGDRIVSVGRPRSASAFSENVEFEVLDCTGCVIAPGFIDAHLSHSDLQVLENQTTEKASIAGVTTEIVGNCGFSSVSIARKSTNIAGFRKRNSLWK